MITIYTPYKSVRLTYVLNYLFRDRLGISWQLAGTGQNMEDGSTLKINYSGELREGYLNIIPDGILSETGIQPREMKVSEYNGMKVIFPNISDTGFDLFSAVFYCLSRYEEYGNTDRDDHGRYSHTVSFLYRNDCIDLPLVDLWVGAFKRLLILRYGYIKDDFKKGSFEVMPTIDIDAVFAYKGRGLIRQVAGFAKSAAQMNTYEIMKRYRVSFRGENDPNDNFTYQFETFKTAGQSCRYFIQVGDYGKFDKNIHASDKAFQNVIRSIVGNGHEVGLHPSYRSGSDKDIILKEKEILENITGQPVTSSRQHYLKFSLPTTYRTLLGLGFRKEYSMGYSQITGFRAATSRPFYWYDLEREEETVLEIIPFCAMDVAYKQFLKMTPKMAIRESMQIRKMLEVEDGLFCTVFHNESLSEHRGWEGWRTVFEEWIKK